MSYTYTLSKRDLLRFNLFFFLSEIFTKSAACIWLSFLPYQTLASHVCIELAIMVLPCEWHLLSRDVRSGIRHHILTCSPSDSTHWRPAAYLSNGADPDIAASRHDHISKASELPPCEQLAKLVNKKQS